MKGHHILTVKGCFHIFLTLLCLTVITIIAPYFDYGYMNLPVAMLIATIKASLVVFYFMGLKFDSTENRVIFFSSFIFVAIFMVFVYSDYLFRKKEVKDAKVYVPIEEVVGSKQWEAKSKLKNN